MSNSPNPDQAQQGLGDYLGQLARATQLQQLLERYLALAPVFIGGPSSTSLEILPHQGGLKSMETAIAGNPSHILPIASSIREQNGLAHLQQIGMLSRLDATKHTSATVESLAAESHNRQSNGVSGHPFMGGKSYFGFLDKVRLAHSAVGVNHHPEDLQRRNLHHHQQQQQQQQHGLERSVKRRRASGGASRNSGSLNHLSGEMIRKLREQQKQRSVSSGGMSSSLGQPPVITNGRPPQVSSSHVSKRKDDCLPSSTTSSAPASVVPYVMKPHPPPLMVAREAPTSDVVKVSLNGKLIPAFSIGGESRLCLPQILNHNLGPFNWDEICQACEELQIHIAPCTSNQLLALKTRGILPLAANQCGLITKSDSERLISYLGLTYHGGDDDNELAENAEMKDDDDDEEDDERGPIDVSHECFGGARALFFPNEYTTPYSRCIKCKECNVMMNPFEFVRHVHTDREKRMCHWGFDPIQWRHYLHLDGKEYAKSRDASLDESLELIQEGLDRLKHVKERFGRRGLKRKQDLDPDSKSHSLKQSKYEGSRRDGDVEVDGADSSTPNDAGHPRDASDSPLRRGKTSPAARFRPWSNENGGEQPDGMDSAVGYSRVHIMTPPLSFRSIPDQNVTELRSHAQHFFQGTNEVPDDPVQYIDDVRQCLENEAGLSQKGRHFITATITRMVDRVHLAENSRAILARELVGLRERFGLIESELSKKREEVRQLFLMQQSASGSTPNPPVSVVHNGRGREIPDIGRNGHGPLSSSPDHDSNGDRIRNISLKRLGVAAMANSINNNLNHNSNDSSSGGSGRSDSGSPLNLSGDVDDSRPDSSVGTCDSKETSDSCRDRLLAMEGEIRAIRNKIRHGSAAVEDDDDDDVDEKQGSEERDLVIVEAVEDEKDVVPSDSPVSEIERRILRRTRLLPRKLPPVVDANLEQEVVVILDEESRDEPPNTTTSEPEQIPSSSSQP